MNPVEKLTEIATRLNVLPVAAKVLGDSRFAHWSASARPTTHHYGNGGLARHTLEVVELCLLNNSYYGTGKIDEESVFLASLFHDIGKTLDYKWVSVKYLELYTADYKIDDCYRHYAEINGGYWCGTEHKYKIHHICRSALIWHDAAKENNVSECRENDVLHAILAHHGRKEWGSPVEPQTKLAWLLHLCDGISARMDDV